jgi:hypothetical protein
VSIAMENRKKAQEKRQTQSKELKTPKQKQ